MLCHPAISASISCAVLLAGCSLAPSPAVGEWSGKMMAPPQGSMNQLALLAIGIMGDNPSARLSLKGDGTGYLKIPNAPERPVSWRMDGDRIILGGADAIAATTTASSHGQVVGRLSDDKKTITLDLGLVQFSLAKAAK